MQVINVQQKFSLFHETWSPKIVGELNDSYVKLARLKGEFIWHNHPEEDELFLVIQGVLTIRLGEQDLTIREGEFLIIPRGVDHCPVANEEVLVMLLEPKSTLNTGNAGGARTVEAGWI